MLDVKGAIENLRSTSEHHYAHIENQHEFMRAWAIQFELSYTDFRVIELAVQMSGEAQHPLLARFAAAYEDVYQYEYAFVAGGLDGFNEKFGDKIPDYEKAKDTLVSVLQEISALE